MKKCPSRCGCVAPNDPSLPGLSASLASCCPVRPHPCPPNAHRSRRQMKRVAIPVTYNRNGNLTPWRCLSRAEKHREIIRYAGQNGGYALTLNFRPDFEAYLRKQVHPGRQLGKRVNRELVRKDLRDLPVLLAIEATGPEGRLHLHGVFLPRSHSRAFLHETMRSAVGRVSGRSGSRQALSKLIYGPDGWTNYIKKDSNFTRRLLSLSGDQALCWVSHAMTRVVRDEYEAVRLANRLPPANMQSKPLLAG